MNTRQRRWAYQKGMAAACNLAKVEGHNPRSYCPTPTIGNDIEGVRGWVKEEKNAKTHDTALSLFSNRWDEGGIQLTSRRQKDKQCKFLVQDLVTARFCPFLHQMSCVFVLILIFYPVRCNSWCSISLDDSLSYYCNSRSVSCAFSCFSSIDLFHVLSQTQLASLNLPVLAVVPLSCLLSVCCRSIMQRPVREEEVAVSLNYVILQVFLCVCLSIWYMNMSGVCWVQVSRKMYIGGFFGLPWLWLVNYIYFQHTLKNEETPVELKKCKLLVVLLLQPTGPQLTNWLPFVVFCLSFS